MKKTIITENSLFNGINQKVLSKNSQNAIIVKIQSFVCGTTENVLDEGDDLVQGKPDCLIIYSITQFYERH